MVGKRVGYVPIVRHFDMDSQSVLQQNLTVPWRSNGRLVMGCMANGFHLFTPSGRHMGIRTLRLHPSHFWISSLASGNCGKCQTVRPALRAPMAHRRSLDPSQTAPPMAIRNLAGGLSEKSVKFGRRPRGVGRHMQLVWSHDCNCCRTGFKSNRGQCRA